MKIINKCEICGVVNSKVYLNKKTGKMLCHTHRSQVYKHGNILERTVFDRNDIIVNGDIIEIILRNRKHIEIGRTITNAKHYDKVKPLKWALSRGYAKSSKDRRRPIGMHRLIIDAPDDLLVDHINGNKLDNREENLRLCTQSENLMNQKINIRNNSGVTGVYWDKQRNKWRAQIKVNQKIINLCRSSDMTTAIKARKEAEVKYFGEFAYDWTPTDLLCPSKSTSSQLKEDKQ